MTERISAPLTPETVIAEYEDLRGFGLSFEAAASRLGLSVDALARRFDRYGYAYRMRASS